MKRQLEQIVHDTVQELFGADISVELTRPDDQFGDYATNIALQLAAKVQSNPRDVAQKLCRM
jgi:arginyl-tRNA synthetase